MLKSFICHSFSYLHFFFSTGKLSCEGKEKIVFFLQKILSSFFRIYSLLTHSPLSSSPLHSGMLVALINSMEHIKTYSGENPNKCNQCNYDSATIGIASTAWNILKYTVEKIQLNKCNQFKHVSATTGILGQTMWRKVPFPS